MISKNEARKIEAAWEQARDLNLTPAAALEYMIAAFFPLMRILINAVESVQTFWDSTGLLAALVAAGDNDALDSGGTYTKSFVYKCQLVFLSFKVWFSTPVSVDIGETTHQLPLTPRQILFSNPTKVSEVVEELPE